MKYLIEGRSRGRGKWAVVHGYYDLSQAEVERCISLILRDMPANWGQIYEYRAVPCDI